MKFSVTKDVILTELQLFQGIVEKRNTMPILANILINATEEKVELIGTDLEVGLKSTCGADIEKEGAVTIAAKKFYEIVRLLPEAEILVELADNDMVQVTCDKVYFKINSLPIEDFPALPTYNFDKALEIPAPLLKEFIRKTFSSIPLEDTRYALLGATAYLAAQALGAPFEHLSRHIKTVRPFAGHRVVSEPLELWGAACFVLSGVTLWVHRSAAGQTTQISDAAPSSGK